MDYSVERVSDTLFMISLGPQVTTISFRISKEDSRKLDMIAKKLGMNKSDLIRRAITEFLQREGVLK